MNPLEKIINTVRIAPHGIIPAVIATALITDRIYDVGLYKNLPQILQSVNTGIIVLCGILAPPHLLEGLEKYQKFKRIIQRRGIDRRHVEPNLKWYCKRQSYKAAAYSLNLGDQFNEINRNYKGRKRCTWIPEI
mgnify:CR=1 FL=1